ncbi:MAG TPA: trypsin-like peptidase domain-containing protein [Kofleriaceae bacterium]|nr:trypsin-like peptidase domain-containing protein [Kofleriaceae bacterium]
MRSRPNHRHGQRSDRAGDAHRRILAALDRADRLRATALAELGRLPLDDSRSGFLLGPELARLLRTRASRLRASAGYLGHALGWKRVAGQVRPELAVTVFVEEKLSARQLARRRGAAVPRRLRSGDLHLATDVVGWSLSPLAQRPRIAGQLTAPIASIAPTAPTASIAPIASIAPAALHATTIVPGASIGPLGIVNPGTLTCFAWDADHRFVGVTAGHVARNASQHDSPAGSGAVFGSLAASSLSPVDAATIVIESPWSQVMPNGSHMIAARPVTASDVGQPVYVYGAQTGQWSAGTLEYLAPWVAGWNVADAIVYSAMTAPGDSGGPVIDPQGHLLGIHLGRGRHDHHDVAIAGTIARVASDFRLTPTF